MHPSNPTSGTLLGDERGDTRSVLTEWGKDHTSSLGVPHSDDLTTMDDPDCDTFGNTF